MCGVPEPTTSHDERPLVDLNEMCAHAGVTIGPNDGVLLLRATPDGQIVPHVLKIDNLTEGRLEAGIMPIYMELNRYRGQMFLKERR